MMTLVWRTRKKMSMGVIISILCSILVITSKVFQIIGKCMVFCETPRRLCVRRKAPSPPSIVHSSFFRQPLTHLDQTTQQLLKCTLHKRVFQYFVFVINVLITKYTFFATVNDQKIFKGAFAGKVQQRIPISFFSEDCSFPERSLSDKEEKLPHLCLKCALYQACRGKIFKKGEETFV